MLTSEPEKPRDYWQEHIAAYLSGSSSIMQYCKEANIAYHQFLYRYNRYHKKQKNTAAKTSPLKPSFAALKVSAPKSSGRPFQITLPNGTQCWIPAVFDKKTLRELLEVLSA